MDEFLDSRVFTNTESVTEDPDSADVAGFEDFFARFTDGLEIEKAAIKAIPLENN